ncbi:hypothetical protein MKX03_015385 [Papaver bracteatum]|nr:hypothetical protein MKX03_015385 [Papaver bracteatum]
MAAALLSSSFLNICVLSSSFLAISIFLFIRFLSSSSSVNAARTGVVSSSSSVNAARTEVKSSSSSVHAHITPAILSITPAILSGGITEIKDAKTSDQLQELGKYSVDQYNLKFKEGEKGTQVFKQVVKAKSQLVAGMNYFLKVSAIQNGKPQLFDAVVYVKAGKEPSTCLVSFDPSFD